MHFYVPSVSLRGLEHLLESNHEVYELEGTSGHKHPPSASAPLIHPLHSGQTSSFRPDLAISHTCLKTTSAGPLPRTSPLKVDQQLQLLPGAG